MVKKFLIPKDPYPDDAKEFKAELTYTMSVLDSILSTVNLTAKNKIVQLREKADQATIIYQETLKAIYYPLQLNPCNKANYDNYNELLTKLVDYKYGLNTQSTLLSKDKNIDSLKLEISLEEIDKILSDFIHKTAETKFEMSSEDDQNQYVDSLNMILDEGQPEIIKLLNEKNNGADNSALIILKTQNMLKAYEELVMLKEINPNIKISVSPNSIEKYKYILNEELKSIR